jgi:hypothetical protein
MLTDKEITVHPTYGYRTGGTRSILCLLLIPSASATLNGRPA